MGHCLDGWTGGGVSTLPLLPFNRTLALARREAEFQGEAASLAADHLVEAPRGTARQGGESWGLRAIVVWEKAECTQNADGHSLHFSLRSPPCPRIAKLKKNLCSKN